MAPSKEKPQSTSTPKKRPLYAPTDLVPWQKLVGGIPVRGVTALFGPPEAGKSTLGGQMVTEYAMAEEGNVLIFDTELNEHTFEDLCSKLSARWGEEIHYTSVIPTVEFVKSKDDATGVKVQVTWDFEEPIKKGVTNVLLVQCPELQDILAIMGRPVEIRVTDGGKVEAEHLKGGWAPSVDQSPIGLFIKQYNVKSLFFDSVTNPLDEIVAKTKNFPGRADLTQLWLVQVGKIAWKFKMPVFTVAHESKNEASGFDKGLKIEGGKGVRYNVKHVLYLMDGNEPGLLPGVVKEMNGGKNPKPLADTGRRLFAARRPGKRSWATNVALDFGDTGFVAYEE